MEKWVDVYGYEDYYQVSSLGRVKSKARTVIRKDGTIRNLPERIIKPVWLNRKGGYYVVALIVDNIRHNLWLSQLMVKSFIGLPPTADERPIVEFINGDNTDYRIENMRWFDRVRRNNMIRDKFARGTSQADLSKLYDLDQSHISTICSGVKRILSLPNDIHGESWERITDISGEYYISNMGRVYAHISGRNKSCGLLTPQKNKNGYMQVIVRNCSGVKKSYRVHRLVAMAFCGGYRDGLVVDHIDGDKTNNKASNLRWVTNAYNIQRANRILPYRDRIIQLREFGMTYTMIGEFLGFNAESISKMCRGKTCKEVIRG